MRNKNITLKDLVNRASIYYSIPKLPYIAIYYKKERILKGINRDKGASF